MEKLKDFIYNNGERLLHTKFEGLCHTSSKTLKDYELIDS